MMRFPGFYQVFVLTSVALSSSCNNTERPCYPGDFIACTCEDEQPGYAACNTDGTAYGACEYCGTTPGEASGGAGGSGGSGGSGGALLPYMSPCETDEQCETNLCFPFNAKGPHCTQACDGADDCPPPSPGCSNMSVCKAP